MPVTEQNYGLIISWQEFDSKIPTWGFSSSPLIEGNLVLVEAGGRDGQAIVAFNKKSGDVVWTTHTDEVGYSSPIPIDFGGVRQIIFPNIQDTPFRSTGKRADLLEILLGPKVSISPRRFSYLTIKSLSPLPMIKGAVLLKMTVDEDGIGIEEVWKSRVMKNHFNSSVLHGRLSIRF